jgi:hypothetical protein
MAADLRDLGFKASVNGDGIVHGGKPRTPDSFVLEGPAFNARKVGDKWVGTLVALRGQFPDVVEGDWATVKEAILDYLVNND